MSQLAPFLLPALLLGGYLVAIALVLFAWRSTPGHRIGPVLAVPLAASVILLGLLLVLFPDESASLLPLLLRGGLVAGGVYGLDPVWTVPIVIATAIGAAVAAHYAVEVLPAGVNWIADRGLGKGGSRRSASVADLSRGVILVALGGAIVSAGSVTRAVIVAPGEGILRIDATYDLPGSPTSIAMIDDRSGYLAFGEGSIVHFTLPSGGGDLDVTEVVDGLTFPRGLAIAEGRLFVIDLGTLPCEDPFPQCWFADPTDELDALSGTAASVLSYEVQADGRLGPPTTVLDGLPVVSTEHAPNDIEVGQDGRLYLAIGHVDRLTLEPDLLALVDHPEAGLLGTVVSFTVDGGELAVLSSGIRNIYELAFDAHGFLYGADNDGQAVRGWRSEQIVVLEQDVDFGFPRYGSFDPMVEADARQIWNLELSGSAGLAWAGDSARLSGLLIGGNSEIAYLEVAHDVEGPYVVNDAASRPALGGIDGFVPSIEALSDGRFVVAVFAPFSGYRNQLLIVSRR